MKQGRDRLSNVVVEVKGSHIGLRHISSDPGIDDSLVPVVISKRGVDCFTRDIVVSGHLSAIVVDNLKVADERPDRDARPADTNLIGAARVWYYRFA